MHLHFETLSPLSHVSHRMTNARLEKVTIRSGQNINKIRNMASVWSGKDSVTLHHCKRSRHRCHADNVHTVIDSNDELNDAVLFDCLWRFTHVYIVYCVQLSWNGRVLLLYIIVLKAIRNVIIGFVLLLLFNILSMELQLIYMNYYASLITLLKGTPVLFCVWGFLH